MERVLIVNADDFGLSKGQNYGIVNISQRRCDLHDGAGQWRGY